MSKEEKDEKKMIVTERFWERVGAFSAILTLGLYIMCSFAILAAINACFAFDIHFQALSLADRIYWLMFETLVTALVMIVWMAVVYGTADKVYDIIRRGIIMDYAKTKSRRQKEESKLLAERAKLKGYLENKGYWFRNLDSIEPEPKKEV